MINYWLQQEAQDLGGPRKEFFKLIMEAVKEKYFDKGLLPHYENDYQTVGSIFGMFWKCHFQ